MTDELKPEPLSVVEALPVADLPVIEASAPIVAAPKKSVKELKEVLLLAVEIVNAGLSVAKDGKVGVEDLGALLKILPHVGPALAGAHEVPAELGDIEGEEVAELVGAVAARLALDGAKAQLVLEKSLKVVAALGELAVAIVK